MTVPADILWVPLCTKLPAKASALPLKQFHVGQPTIPGLKQMNCGLQGQGHPAVTEGNYTG